MGIKDKLLTCLVWIAVFAIIAIMAIAAAGAIDSALAEGHTATGYIGAFVYAQ